MIRFLLAIFIFSFTTVPAMAETVVRYTMSGRPINTIGRHISSQQKSSSIPKNIRVVRYNISGNPVNSVGKPLSQKYDADLPYKYHQNQSNRIIDNEVKSTIVGHQLINKNIGGSKPPMVMVNTCGGGITYYEKGVARCGS